LEGASIYGVDLLLASRRTVGRADSVDGAVDAADRHAVPAIRDVPVPGRPHHGLDLVTPLLPVIARAADSAHCDGVLDPGPRRTLVACSSGPSTRAEVCSAYDDDLGQQVLQGRPLRQPDLPQGRPSLGRCQALRRRLPVGGLSGAPCSSDPLDITCAEFVHKDAAAQLDLATLWAAPDRKHVDPAARMTGPAYQRDLVDYCPNHPDDKLCTSS
jgi:hypothetical protein